MKQIKKFIGARIRKYLFPLKIQNCFFKYEYESNPVIVDTNINTLNKSRNKKSTPNSVSLRELPTATLALAYNEPLKISNNQCKDLISMCDSNAILLHYQSFFPNLIPVLMNMIMSN
jgi:hypothetical protein